MAARAILTVEQVLDELDNNEELSEGSEDEFDGYLEKSGMMGIEEDEETSSRSPERGDMDVENEMDVENDMNEMDDINEMDVENAASDDPSLKDSRQIPQYVLQPGIANTQSDKSPFAYFSRFVT